MTKPVLLIAQPILAPLTGVLAEDYELVRLWEHPDLAAFLAGEGQRIEAIVAAGEGPLGPDLLGGLPRLRLIACVSAGYDGVDVGWCAGRGIAVTHSPGVNAEDVADHAVGAAICAWRGIAEGHKRVREGRWTESDRGPMRPSLRGRKVGIVGLGGIGAAIATRMAAFGCPIAWWGPNPKPDAAWPMAESLMALAKASDLLFVALRAGPESRRLVNRGVIEAVGSRGLICNVSRGFVIDQDALISALKDGRLGYAALDVFDPEPTTAETWAGVPNLVLTPHTAGATLESVPAMVAMMRENLRRHFAGEPLATPVRV
ncbi:NAD(P)-dependent oxidoreductase [Phenylobacterium montanum]|uniref:2-hydroxyacid dehydrogenase n=1 Tax=Phenylobacterium montanum TaxID=2823693 RepID=A0A975ISX7_9CAUL|nr:NAD(P)-dependent oxidoreductase [Caulobacter sp. S6]QUD86145.1 2-hydroxyacid dehydrogenase [Caulobacter sp. S6]